MNKKVVVLLALMSFSFVAQGMDYTPWTSTGGDDVYNMDDCDNTSTSTSGS